MARTWLEIIAHGLRTASHGFEHGLAWPWHASSMACAWFYMADMERAWLSTAQFPSNFAVSSVLVLVSRLFNLINILTGYKNNVFGYPWEIF